MQNKAFLNYVFDDDLYIIDRPEVQKEALKEPETEYKKELETSTSDEPVTKDISWPSSYKGENNKHITILVNYPSEDHISNQDEEFLLKILSAVNLSLSDVAIINLANNQCSLEQLTQFNTTKVLLFGSLESTPDLSNYQLTELSGIKIHKANSLGEIQNNVAEKKLLWGNLQKLFL
ncbi:DNA polymerase III subunit psi [Fulvivirga lutea]|uniref:DNA polymerase III subunit psi n=1 Tax=Fulvivirga lutea TaxID=2810512 RepID=A0A974WFY3_9BACT|nr:DNA polymerase III subunit psi [Fulvivirga lutea]QSE96848.1 DNA polymerase III subunit psi [Fulvivirga lutea]